MHLFIRVSLYIKVKHSGGGGGGGGGIYAGFSPSIGLHCFVNRITIYGDIKQSNGHYLYYVGLIWAKPFSVH